MRRGRYKHGLYTKEKIALGKFVREQLNELEYLAILCGLIGLPKQVLDTGCWIVGPGYWVLARK